MMLNNRDVENCEDTLAIMLEKGETKERGRTYCLAGAPNDVRYKNNTLAPGISMRYLPKYVPALKASNIYHCSNQGNMTNTFSWKNGYFKSLFPYRTRLFHNLFGWHFASEEWRASYCYLFHALEMYTVLSCLGNAVLSFSLQPCSMVP